MGDALSLVFVQVPLGEGLALDFLWVLRIEQEADDFVALVGVEVAPVAAKQLLPIFVLCLTGHETGGCLVALDLLPTALGKVEDRPRRKAEVSRGLLWLIVLPFPQLDIRA